MKREKRLTKKERKASDFASGARTKTHTPAKQGHHHHIHCIACGRHLDANMFGEANGATFIRCEHGSDFPSCTGCTDKATALVQEHDRTNTAVKTAAAWH